MGILKELGEIFKRGIISDSGLKTFLHESGISPKPDYQKQISENTRYILNMVNKNKETLEDLSRKLREITKNLE